MSRKNNRMSRKDNCNVYKIESLEKREMLSATAEDAAVDWINEQVITEVSTNLNLSENDIVKVGGTNLSINDLINGSFVLTSSSVASSSSEYVPFDHSRAFDGTLWRKGAYETFVDKRNDRKYYYLQVDGKDTAGKAASIKVMAENLNVGEMVRGFKDQKDDSKIERYCYDNDTTNCDRYGGLYQWAEMMNLPFECNSKSCADSIKPNHQGICPDDWRLLTYNDFYIIVNSNGNQDGVKGTRSTFGFGGSNDTGYSLVGAGVRALRNGVYSFEQLNEFTVWYYPREISVDGVVYPTAGHTSRTDTYTYGKDTYNYTKLEGFSVRCVLNE